MKKRWVILLLLLTFLVVAGFIYWQKNQNSIISNQPFPSQTFLSQSPSSTIMPSVASPTPNSSLLTSPMNNALARVTKKTFGLYVSPGHSPVSPEKFNGYHTGVDFEIMPGEENIDVPIFTACAGPLLLKKSATGYGGVAVQQCRLENQNVTIIYGHLRLTSISAKVGDILSASQQIAVLGTGYSAETDGERKHLHLGIHKGTSINLLGYVQNSSELSGWLNALNYLK